jgi:DNA-binding response OmpR family regulator
MSTDPEKPRVLVVEDSRTVAAIVKLFLQREGFEVFVAADGVAGLEAAKRERPCVTITDVNMPGMDGPDLVRALRADDQTRDMFIFMLSSDERPECQTLALAAGADEYVVKPVQPGPFAARVRAAVERTAIAP